MGNKRLTLEHMQIAAEARGGKCLSESYQNAHVKLEWLCSKGHKFSSPWNQVSSAGTWCPKCAQGGFDLRWLQDLAEKRGGQCLASAYLGMVVRVEWQCAVGHVWQAMPHNIKNGGWCPTCNTFRKTETGCRQILEDLLQTRLPSSRPEWLVNSRGNRMEFDGYSDGLKFAFECQGRQHFDETHRFNDNLESFQWQLQRDAEKILLCKQRGISLLVVSWDKATDREALLRMLGVQCPVIFESIL